MDPRPMVLAVVVAVVLAVLALAVAGFCSGMSSGSTDRPPGIPSFTGLKLGGNVTVGVTVTCL